MKNNILGFLCATLIVAPFGVSAQTQSFRFNQENWFSVPHPQVATFRVSENGNAYGTTTTNVPFRQYTLPNTGSVRVQRFEIQDHYHYIVEGHIAYTLSELSRQLARATG